MTLETMPSTPPRIALAEKCVLCVQPNRAFHSALETALSRCRIVLVGNALEAIRARNQTAFDAYVLDYWLPDWSGASLCREIRKTDPHVPVCFFTAADGDEQHKRALRAGADAYVHAIDGAAVLADKLRNRLRAADVGSLSARVEGERAVREELLRRSRIEIACSELARARAREAIERAARLRAQKVFIKGGGTLANFERFWPQVFASAAAECRPAERFVAAKGIQRSASDAGAARSRASQRRAPSS